MFPVYSLFACWVSLHVVFFSSDDFLSFKSTFSKIYFRNTVRVSNSLDLDQARRFQNYLQTTLVGEDFRSF